MSLNLDMCSNSSENGSTFLFVTFVWTLIVFLYKSDRLRKRYLNNILINSLRFDSVHPGLAQHNYLLLLVIFLVVGPFILLGLFLFFRGRIPKHWQTVQQVHSRRVICRGEIIAAGCTLRLAHYVRSAALQSVSAYLN